MGIVMDIMHNIFIYTQDTYTIYIRILYMEFIWIKMWHNIQVFAIGQNKIKFSSYSFKNIFNTGTNIAMNKVSDNIVTWVCN